MINLGTMAVKLTLKSKEFKDGIKKAKKELKSTSGASDAVKKSLEDAKNGMSSFAKSGKEDLKGLNSSLGTIGKVIGGVAVLVAGAASAIRNSIKVAAIGDTIKDEAQKVYMSTTAYQEWDYVLRQNGSSIDAMKMGMKTFAASVAKGDSKLKKYGVTSGEVSEAFEQAVASIQNMDSETEKLAASIDLFGSRVASELMPVLNMTNEETKGLMETYRAIGGTMSDELIAKSDVLTDSILEMKTAWQGIKNTIGEAVMPAITRVVQGMTLLFAKISIVLQAIFNLKSTFGSLSGGSGGGVTASIADDMGSAASSAKELRRQLAGFDELNNLSSSSGSGGGGVSVSGGDFDGGVISKAFDSDMLKNLDQFRQKVDKIKGKLQQIVPVALTLAGIALICLGHPVAGIALAGLGISIGVSNGGFEQIGEKIGEAWKTAKEVTVDMLNEIKRRVSEKWTEIKGSVSDVYFEVRGRISQKWSDLQAKWEALTSNVKDKTVEFKGKISQKWADLKASWESITNNVAAKTVEFKGKISQTWDNLKAAWSNIVDNVKDKTANMKATIATAWSSLKTSWAGITDNIKDKTANMRARVASTWTELKDTWETLLSNFKDKTVSVWLKISASVDNLKTWINDKVITPINNRMAEHSLTKNIKIPLLAGGGVLTAPTIAMMGEYPGAKSNPEIAAPQSILRETIDASNGALADVGRAILGVLNDQTPYLRQAATKQLTISPSTNLGRVNAISARMYKGVTG